VTADRLGMEIVENEFVDALLLRRLTEPEERSDRRLFVSGMRPATHEARRTRVLVEHDGSLLASPAG
jgi:hypothetical protein